MPRINTYGDSAQCTWSTVVRWLLGHGMCSEWVEVPGIHSEFEKSSFAFKSPDVSDVHNESFIILGCMSAVNT
jgi:hypothetical protein